VTHKKGERESELRNDSRSVVERMVSDRSELSFIFGVMRSVFLLRFHPPLAC
jgi:hypothetical protein